MNFSAKLSACVIGIKWHVHFQTAQKNSAYALFFYTQSENSNDVTPV